MVLAGLDPGGGAGLLADARAILAAGAFPCAVTTVSTVQSTSGLRASRAIAASEWREQAREVLAHQRVGAFKVGALGSVANVRAAADLLARHDDVPAVVDPVLLPTRGAARLLEERGLRALRRDLVPRAALVTANAPEAEALTGAPVRNVREARLAAQRIVAMGARAALVKGGHLSGASSVDVLFHEGEWIELGAPRLRLPRGVHGSGCTLSSLIAGRLARGDGLRAAVRFAKRTLQVALLGAVDVGGHLSVLLP